MTPNPASAEPRPDSTGGSGVPRHVDGNVPKHVAIIMDGNGRWAKARGLPRAAGHKAGAEAARKTLRAMGEAGVECLTLYAFSSENWRRPETEINDLMGLLRFYLQSELEALHREGIRLKVIGDHTAFKPDITRMIDHAVSKTAANQRMILAIALNYGARNELLGAVRALAATGVDMRTVEEDQIEAALDTADLPSLDLLIRTSGEYRLSNFLLWQAAYAELLFVDTLWPDFDEAAVKAALADFAARERRYGGL